jgi:hypothetical protein
MVERRAADQSFSLREAVERYTPRELWQRYFEIAKEEIPLIIIPNWNPLNMEARHLRGKIERILTAKLKAGELVASGLALPLRPTTRRHDIRPELWSRLRLDIRRQEASGDGLKFVELRFREPRPISMESVPTPAKERQPKQRRPAGRPSFMSEIEAEMRRRATSGELAATLVAESEALAEWAAAQQHLIGRHVPKPLSIQRKLGEVYRELKGQIKADK